MSASVQVFDIADAAAMEAFGAALADATARGSVVFLQGELGAGKTTLARGFLRASGHGGAVKSPTYTLVEPYELATGSIYHFDLYRLGDAEELEFMGIRDYFGENSVCLVEWADRGLGVLPAADIVVSIETENSGRRLSVSGASDRGRSALERLGERYRA
ncbi:MAG: tRNA (adenosine(37)-N6)-threonylcarbamoyltransferase complex ATPase subunit type 1 TsaE [Halioglobus sp.]|mgnify:FL=1|nr:tRNA (adenosine(37)-N6)-threonylcarbamoyltransferase complex ATPase subunit type 1 TsaE [Halioglobus sp.]